MHFLITLVCLLVAAGLWIAGVTTDWVYLFVLAGIFEIAFWKRLLPRRRA